MCTNAAAADRGLHSHTGRRQASAAHKGTVVITLIQVYVEIAQVGAFVRNARYRLHRFKKQGVARHFHPPPAFMRKPYHFRKTQIRQVFAETGKGNRLRVRKIRQPVNQSLICRPSQVFKRFIPGVPDGIVKRVATLLIPSLGIL